MEPADIMRYQLSDFHALVSSKSAKISANIDSGSKSSAVEKYIIKVTPDSRRTDGPEKVDLVLLEGENIIAVAPTSKKSLHHHVLDLFTYKIKPYFSQSKVIALFFDDRSGGLSLSLRRPMSADTIPPFTQTSISVQTGLLSRKQRAGMQFSKIRRTSRLSRGFLLKFW